MAISGRLVVHAVIISRNRYAWEGVCRAKRMCAANESFSLLRDISSISNHNEVPNYATYSRALAPPIILSIFLS